MAPDLPYALLIGIFVAVLFLVEGAWSLARDHFGNRDAVNRRLRMLARGQESGQVMATLRRHSRNGDEDGRLVRLFAAGPLQALDRSLSQAGMSISTPRFVARMAGLAAGTFVLGMLVLHLALWQAALAGIVVGILLPPFWVRLRARRRLDKFSAQLPDAIDMVVRSLRAGHPIATAIGTLSREMPDPIGSEFGLVFDEMTYGLDLREALENMAERLPITDLHYLVVAVRVQYGTGGNLAEVLASLSRVIRDRFRMNCRIRALSAEGRLSALILSALPFVLAGIVMLLRPKYYLDASVDPAFLPLMGSGVFGVVLGIIAMQRIVNFRF